MSLSDAQLNQLHIEIAESKAAEQAYNLFIKSHIDKTVAQIYDGIEQCATTDVDALQKLKIALSAIRGLESSVQNTIESGKIANLTLEKHNG